MRVLGTSRLCIEPLIAFNLTVCPSYLHSLVNLSDSRDLRCNCRLETPNYNTIKYGKKKFEIYRSISLEWY